MNKGLTTLVILLFFKITLLNASIETSHKIYSKNKSDTLIWFDSDNEISSHFNSNEELLDFNIIVQSKDTLIMENNTYIIVFTTITPKLEIEYFEHYCDYFIGVTTS